MKKIIKFSFIALLLAGGYFSVNGQASVDPGDGCQSATLAVVSYEPLKCSGKGSACTITICP